MAGLGLVSFSSEASRLTNSSTLCRSPGTGCPLCRICRGQAPAPRIATGWGPRGKGLVFHLRFRSRLRLRLGLLPPGSTGGCTGSRPGFLLSLEGSSGGDLSQGLSLGNCAQTARRGRSSCRGRHCSRPPRCSTSTGHSPILLYSAWYPCRHHLSGVA